MPIYSEMRSIASGLDAGLFKEIMSMNRPKGPEMVDRVYLLVMSKLLAMSVEARH